MKARALGWDAECTPAVDETLARQEHWLGTWATQEEQVAGDNVADSMTHHESALRTTSALCTGLYDAPCMTLREGMAQRDIA